MQIYIHIPFCEQKCSYCRFASVGSTQSFLVEKYVRYLCKEIENYLLNTNKTSLLNTFQKKEKKTTVSTIYFGGGTPGVLSQEQFKKIFDSLRTVFTFSEDIEVTLESTPDKVTEENIKGWKQQGFNRLSMGVQTLNSKSLEAIGRGNKGDIKKALKNIKNTFHSHTVTKAAGDKEMTVSLDFIIGLPHVEKAEIKKDIEFILKKYSFVKHISVYMLEDYYNSDKVIETAYDKKTYPENWGELGLKEEEYLGEYIELKDYLESQGFQRYEISNYSLPGYECKHNQGYWNHSEIIAFGLGGYGFIDGVRYANSEQFGEYYDGKKIYEEKLLEKDIFLETVMFQLRTSGIQEDIYKKLNQEKLEYFLKEEFLEKESDKIILSDRGVLVMDYILSEIIYL